MARFLPLIRSLGAAGAAANARAELDSADLRIRQATAVARRVNRSDGGHPLSPSVEARVA